MGAIWDSIKNTAKRVGSAIKKVFTKRSSTPKQVPNNYSHSKKRVVSRKEKDKERQRDKERDERRYNNPTKSERNTDRESKKRRDRRNKRLNANDSSTKLGGSISGDISKSGKSEFVEDKDGQLRSSRTGVLKNKGLHNLSAAGDEPKEGFFKKVGYGFKQFGYGAAGILEDTLEGLGWDDEHSAWFNSSVSTSAETSFNQGITDAQSAQNRIGAREDIVDNTIYDDDLSKEAQDVMSNNPVGDTFARDFFAQQNKNIFDQIRNYESKSNSPSAIHSIFLDQQSKNYQKSSLRDRGIAGIFGA